MFWLISLLNPKYIILLYTNCNIIRYEYGQNYWNLFKLKFNIDIPQEIKYNIAYRYALHIIIINFGFSEN